MKKITIINIDDLFRHIASKVAELDVCGQDVRYWKVNFNGDKTLFKWFFNHLEEIKAGADNLLIAKAIGKSNWQYAGDHIRITSIPAIDKNFIVIIISTTKYFYEKNSNFKSETTDESFVLRIE